MTFQRLSLCFSILVSVIVFGCGTTEPTTPSSQPWNPTTGAYTAEYTDNTVYLDSGDVAKLLISTDSATRELRLSNTDPRIRALTPGTNVLVWRTAMGEVTSVRTEGSTTFVRTKATPLINVLKNAAVSYDHSVEWNAQSMAPTLVDKRGEHHVMTPVGRDSFDLELEWGDFTYKILWVMKGDNARVLITAEKKILQGLRARYTLDGTLSRFRTKSTMVIVDRTTTEYSVENTELKGDFAMIVNCLGSGNDAVNFEWPITLVKVPISVGPLVIVMNVRVQVVINAVVPPDGASLIEVRFTYDSDNGVRYANGQLFGLGGAGSHTEENIKAQTGASTPMGVNFGLGFPRLEFKLYDQDVLVPWIQTAMLVGGDFTTGVKPCQTMKTSFIGSAGVDMQMLGITLKRTIPLWNIEKVHLKSGICD